MRSRSIAVCIGIAVLLANGAAASILFSTGNPDGLLGALSQPGTASLPETETADDFILGQSALINGATFTGLVPLGTSLAALDAAEVEIELYHIFPVDSTIPPDARVPTRANSPSDTEFAAFDKAAGDISIMAAIVNPSLSVGNSVVIGINAVPDQTTHGEGPVTGEVVHFTVMFNTPFLVGGTDHDFFRPEVGLASGNFLWLSAPRPIVAPGTPFTGDLQAWIRNAPLDPDWLRIGTDIIGGATPPTFNMTFSLLGTPVPEPTAVTLLCGGLIGMAVWRRRVARR